MAFVTWNVRSLYRSGSLKTVASKLANCNTDLVALQEVRWDNVGSEPEDDYTFLMKMGCKSSFRDDLHYL
jgi:exonuclease III